MSDLELLKEIQKDPSSAEIYLEPSSTLKGYWEVSVSYLGETRTGIHLTLRDAIDFIIASYLDCCITAIEKVKGIKPEDKPLIIIP